MIYLGAQCLPQALNIVALSEGFVLLDQHYFNVDNYDNIKMWIDSVKISPHEPARWFFDEKDFNKHKHPRFVFESLELDYSIYLVNHRQLANVIQFFYEWIAREFDFATRPEPAFFLASARRIFTPKQIKQYISNIDSF